MKSLTVKAEPQSLEAVQAFISAQLEGYDCPVELEIPLQIAVEELFVNIAHYAYAPDEGMAWIDCDIIENDRPRIIIRFMDEGKPFNPLAKPDADITLSAQERNIGGLGIFMVKESMDVVSYLYENNRNILTIEKILDKG